MGRLLYSAQNLYNFKFQGDCLYSQALRISQLILAALSGMLSIVAISKSMKVMVATY